MAFGRKQGRKQESGVAQRLAGVTFFEGFSEEELARVAQLVDEVDAEAGAELTEQGRVGQTCYVIEAGRAGVMVSGEHVATLETGTVVGEMALVDHRPRSATVTAETPMKLLALDAKSFRSLLDEMPKASQRVMTLLNARLRDNA